MQVFFNSDLSVYDDRFVDYVHPADEIYLTEKKYCN